MAKFRFPLDPLLKARRAVEQSRQRQVAQIEAERVALENRLRAQQQHISADKRQMSSSLVGTINVQQLRSHAASTLDSVRLAQQLVLQLHGVHQRLNAARQELIEAARDRRAVEILREKRFEEWKQTLSKAEDAAVDELAVIAAARKKKRSEN